MLVVAGTAVYSAGRVLDSNFTFPVVGNLELIQFSCIVFSFCAWAHLGWDFLWDLTTARVDAHENTVMEDRLVVVVL